MTRCRVCFKPSEDGCHPGCQKLIFSCTALVDVKQLLRDIKCGRVCARGVRMKAQAAELCAHCAVRRFPTTL